MLRIFIHTNDELKFQTAQVEPEARIGSLVKVFVPQEASNKDYQEDVEVYLENRKHDFDKGKTFQDVGIKNGAHLFIGRCKRVQVTVNYAGLQYEVKVPPSQNVEKLRKRALRYFDIDPLDGTELFLWIGDTYLDRQLVGSLTEYPKCSVELLLATKQDVLGSVDQNLFDQHLQSPEFLSGELEGRWGSGIAKGPSWPFCIFWIDSKGAGRFYFRFELANYNEEAPTAILWDIEKNEPLDKEFWPRFNKRCSQIFRNAQSIYLPCDRQAAQGHNDWPRQHSHLMWIPYEDTVVKYLVELHQTLNS